MSSTVLYMSMSLDGFIAGPNESPDNPLGDGGHRLHQWALGNDADRPSPDFARWPNVTYLSDLESAVGQAKQVAGDKDVLVHGASIAQWTLAAGRLDEVQIHLVPVLLGEGRRLFEHLGTEQRQLEPVRVEQGRDATHLRYRVRR